MTNTNKPTIKTRNTAVAAGIDKHIASAISIGNVLYTPAALKALFTDHNAAIEATDALHTQWRDQVAATHGVGGKANDAFLLLRSALIGQYGKSASAILNDFGMNPPKPPGPKTVEAKARGIEKRLATRAARHTLGPVQRKAVTGETVAHTPATPSNTTGH